MLTISQVAAYAGVTVRTVRHYHAKGLVPEPVRDRSGYRRYDAAAVVTLIRVRTLAEAGVPLSRVRELLSASEAEFARAVTEIDQRLQDEIRERERHRTRIAGLAAGDSLALPAEVVAYLATLRRVGVPDVVVDAERDAWILVAAQLPDLMPFYMDLKQQQIADPTVQELYCDLADVITWRPDDPRLIDLVNRLVEQFEATPSSAWLDDLMPDELAALLDAFFVDSVPAATRILDLLRERGWMGWTKIRPLPRHG